MIQQDRSRKSRKWAKRIVLCLVAATVALSFSEVPSRTYAAAASGAVYTGQDIITSGAILKHYVWNSTRNGQPSSTNVNVVEVSLTNPLVSLDAIAGIGNQFTKKQTATGMAAETGAVAVINGDFYNTQAEGVPEGPQISNGKLMATPMFLPGMYSFALTKDNKPIIDRFTFQGAVYAQDGSSFFLGGINKTYYWFEPSGQHSMIDSMYMYTDAWGQIDRSNDGVTVPTEVLVQNGIIKKIAVNDIIKMIPPSDGYILRASGNAADYVVAHLKEGEPLNAQYAIVAEDPSKSYDYKTFKMMIGSNSLMVDNGQPTADFSRGTAGLGGYRARTGIGFSKDEKFAYLITAERTPDGQGGLSMQEFQQVMTAAGICKGINLDGGGSTQLVARPLGETATQEVGETENGVQRKVVNGVGVWTNAPQGQPAGLKIAGSQTVLLNEKNAYTIKAYDQYYNPVPVDGSQVQWSSAGGTFEGNVFRASQKGTVAVTATTGTTKQSTNVKVASRADIQSMAIRASSSVLAKDANIKLSVTVKLKDGTQRTVPGDSFQWEVKGFKGEVAGDNLHITDLNGATSGQLIARYDGFSTILPMSTGYDKLWSNFDTQDVPVSFMATPNEVTGAAAKKAGLPGLAASNNAIELTYDMKQGTGTKAAYAVFGDGTGVPVEGSPQTLSVNVLGDNSLNWLRAEVLDANGKSYLLDLARIINWTGWKTQSVSLAGYQMAYPIKLKRIYVANIAEGQDERAATGTIGLDDITFQYKNASDEPARNQIKLVIDNPNVTVNGKAVKLDTAPYIVSGNTLVPIRFITEALGGTIDWNGQERKVTVYRGGQMAEMWLDQVNLTANGNLITAEVAPQLKNQLSMVPLRVLSENLGWKVGWDPATRTVTLE